MKPSVVRILLVTLLLAVQLATVAIVVMGMRNQATDHVGEVARQGLEQFGQQVSRRTNQLTAQADQAIQTGRHLITSGLLDARSDQSVQTFLLGQLQVQRHLSGMQLVRDDGSRIAVTRVAEGLQGQIITGSEGQQLALTSEYDNALKPVRSWANPRVDDDLRSSQWYQAARLSGLAVWTGVAPDGRQRPEITVAGTANHPDTTDAGVLSASVSLRSVAAQLSGLELADNGSVALIDPNGNTLAYLSGATLQSAFDPARTLPIEQSIQSPMRELFARLGIDLASEQSPVQQWRRNSGFASFPAAQSEYFGLIEPIAVGSGQMTWLLGAVVPATSYMGNLAELFKRKMRTLLAVILIPALIAVLALFGLNDPVVESKEDNATDELTGFLNRAEFRRRLEGMLRNRRELEYGGRIVVTTMDLDGFQKLVARHGRDVGDSVLRQFSRRLRNRVRQHDLLGRSGPDRFLIALRIDRGADVLTTINRIRRATVVKPFATATGRHMLGVTAGIAAVDPDESVDDLLARADQALVTGKVRHRNRTYLAAAPDTGWPQTGIAPREESTPAGTHRSPTLEI